MKIVLFDYDGTLNDSLEANLYAFQGVAKEFDLPPLTLQQLLEWYSPNWYALYEKMGVPTSSWEKADEIWLEYYDQTSPRLFPDSIETLRTLRQMGCKVGLVTGGTRNRVEKELKARGVHRLFHTIVYGSDVVREELKPSPTQIRMALETLQGKRRESLYVGDTPVDILAGKKAGVMTAATTRGFSSTIRLRQAKPDFIIDNLGQLLEIVEAHRTR